MSLLSDVAETLEGAHVPFAMIGAGALAAHGVARSTWDLDLLATERAVLEQGTWIGLAERGAHVEMRHGEAEDPLAGVVRVTREGDRPVDLVVGRHAWQARAVERAPELSFEGRRLRVVGLSDLVLLKLYAGGVQDLWDVRQLLAGDGAAGWVDEVERDLGALPASCRESWSHLRTGSARPET